MNETHNIMQVIKLGEDILNHLGAIVYDASVSEQKDSTCTCFFPPSSETASHEQTV